MHTRTTPVRAFTFAMSFVAATSLPCPLSANTGTRDGSTQAVGAERVRAWEAPEWKSCLAAFKRTAKHTMYPREQRLIDGKCLPSTNTPHVPDGACFMEAVSPSDFLSATGVEVKLVCMRGFTDVMVCTNKKGHYIAAMTDGMSNDKRCEGFPDLLAVNMRKKGPNKALQNMFKDRKPNSAECEVQVKAIQMLENDPRFDNDRRIRQVWSDRVALGTKMGCEF